MKGVLEGAQVLNVSQGLLAPLRRAQAGMMQHTPAVADWEEL